MKHEIRTCDICEKQVHGGEFYTVKIRSSMFVNYYNFDQFFADRKSFDICENCRHLFFMFVNDMKKPKVVSEEVET